MNLNFCFDTKTYKKKVLVSFVVTELVLGGLFFIWLLQQKKVTTTDQSMKSIQARKVAKIDKDSLIFPEEEYTYYFELEPNITIKDHPEWLADEAVYTYNQDGLNERRDYETTKPHNTFRIIALGDSFTYGHYVDTRDSWPEKLELYLNTKFETDLSFEVINLGMPGFDIPYIVKRYQNKGAKYKPDLVLWFESGMGFYRFIELMKPYIEECENNTDQEELKQEYPESYYHYCSIKAQNKIENQYPREDLDKFLTQKLGELFEFVDSGKLIYFTFSKKTLDNQCLNLIQDWEQSFPKASFINLVPEFGESEMLPDGHPSKRGHELIAKEIFTYLEEKSLWD